MIVIYADHLDTGRYANAEEVLEIALQLLTLIQNTKLGSKKLANKLPLALQNLIEVKALMEKLP
jgi:hypothetical protein